MEWRWIEPGAVYAFSIARNHDFADGNKRTAWVIARLFLLDNGFQLTFTPDDAIGIMEALAAGEIEQNTLAQ